MKVWDVYIMTVSKGFKDDSPDSILVNWVHGWWYLLNQGRAT